MIELVEFVKVWNNGNKELKLLFLFYGFLVVDIWDEINKRWWRVVWEVFVGIDDLLVKVMIEVFEEFWWVNGFEFLCFEFEEVYREVIVKIILGFLFLDLRFDIFKWEGCDWLCKVLINFLLLLIYIGYLDLFSIVKLKYNLDGFRY